MILEELRPERFELIDTVKPRVDVCGKCKNRKTVRIYENTDFSPLLEFSFCDSCMKEMLEKHEENKS